MPDNPDNGVEEHVALERIPKAVVQHVLNGVGVENRLDSYTAGAVLRVRTSSLDGVKRRRMGRFFVRRMSSAR